MPEVRNGSRTWLTIALAIGAAAVVGIVVVVLVLGRRGQPDAPASQARPATSAPVAASPAASPAAPGVAYVNDRLRQEIATHGLTVDRARQLFALEVASVPGVIEPDGPVRPTI